MDMFSSQRKFQLRDYQLDPIPVERDGVYISDWVGGVDPQGKLELNKSYEISAGAVAKVINIVGDANRPKGSVYKLVANLMGVTSAKSEAFLNYTRAMELVIPRQLTLTPFAEFIDEFDPSFVDPGSLWLLHYLAASNHYLVVWNYLFNQLLPKGDLVSKSNILKKFDIFTGRWTEYTIKSKASDELQGLFLSYSDYLFSDLNIFSYNKKSSKLTFRTSNPVPKLIFLSTMLVFRDRYHPGSTAMDIREISYSNNSPGRLLFLNELVVRKQLDELHDAGWLNLESSANLDQVRFRQDVSWLKAAALYFEG